MKRIQLNILDKWLSKPNRKPLIIRGARQVGKSTLIRLFSEHKNMPLAGVNLECFPDLAAAFSRNDPMSLLNVLEALPNIGAITQDTILFLDEIQAVPEANTHAMPADPDPL